MPRASAAPALVTFPPPRLADRVDLCWAAAAGESDGPGDTSFQEFFPDAGAHLVFRRSPAGRRMVLLGPVTERAVVERVRGAEYLGVRFRAGQAPRLADVPSAALTNGSVEVPRLGGLALDDVAAELDVLPDPAARLLRLAELATLEPAPLVSDPRCRRAALLLEGRGGHVRVEALAAELGLHVRSLERRFVEAFAMTPKRLARLVRLRIVLGALHAGAYRTLADLAVACGYADQPHLVRDFKGLTGHLPGDDDAARNRVVARPLARTVHRVRRQQRAPRAVSRSHKIR